MKAGRCARHQFNGLFIVVAVALANIAINIGAKPSPTNQTAIQSEPD
jgi:hypothetical protein